MFTGIVNEIGKVKSFVKKASVYRLEVECKDVSMDLDIGDSVAVNGVCLSVVEINETLTFDVVDNTIKTTNLKRFKRGDLINLENAVKMGQTISGHMVSGHIDGERTIKNNKKTSRGWVIDVAMLPGDEKHLIPKGSVAIDGTSLTVGELFSGAFRIFLIPHTLDNTILKFKKSGDYVNVEFDMMGKYSEKEKNKRPITKNMLMEKGFM